MYQHWFCLLNLPGYDDYKWQYSSILSDMCNLIYFHFHNNQALILWKAQKGNNWNLFTSWQIMILHCKAAVVTTHIIKPFKIDVWPFYDKVVCFPMHLYGHHTFVWEKCWEFQTTSSLKPLDQCCSNFMWSLLRLGERKIAKMIAVHWPRWPPYPYQVKAFKNLLLQNRGHLGAKSLHKLGTGGLPKLLKWWSYIVVWPFYGGVKFASVCICMCPVHCWEFPTTSPLKPLANVAQISYGASLGWGNERLLKWLRSIDQDGCYAHIW